VNCKPGDMAVVVSGGHEGLIVEVLRVSDYYGAPHWRVHTAWLVRGTNPDGTTEMIRIGSIHDSRLRPIRPAGTIRKTDEPRECEV
jgi:hypothetical protein